MVVAVDDLTIDSAGCWVNVTVASPGGLMPTAPAMLAAPLVNEPTAFEVTGTEIVHEAIPAARLPVTATVVPPSGAVTTPDGHVVVAAATTWRPAGRLSVNDHP